MHREISVTDRPGRSLLGDARYLGRSCWGVGAVTSRRPRGSRDESPASHVSVLSIEVCSPDEREKGDNGNQSLFCDFRGSTERLMAQMLGISACDHASDASLTACAWS
jgi:hypothetical protein